MRIFAVAAQNHCILESGVEKVFDAEADVDENDGSEVAENASDVDEHGNVEVGGGRTGDSLGGSIEGREPRMRSPN